MSRFLIVLFLVAGVTFGGGKALQRAIKNPSLVNTMTPVVLVMMGTVLMNRLGKEEK